jgi:hypothetical protein
MRTSGSKQSPMTGLANDTAEELRHAYLGF